MANGFTSPLISTSSTMRSSSGSSAILSTTPSSCALLKGSSKKTESTDHPVLLRSDQGVQYSSAGYCNLLSQYNVIQSMSRAGNPYDNAVMESFWSRFKDTLRKHFRYWEKDDLYAVVAECVHHFNHCRPLRKLNGKPPALFRTELVA